MKRTIVSFFSLLAVFSVNAETTEAEMEKQGRSLVFKNANGDSLRLTPYGEEMIRVQRAAPDSDFFADNHYEMVLSHQWSGKLTAKTVDGGWTVDGGSVNVTVDAETLATDFYSTDGKLLLDDVKGVTKDAAFTSVQFAHDKSENFTGLGHGYYARTDSINLKGQVIERNYGKVPIEQAPLIVPFYMSSKGYGVFLNSTFSNRFSFGHEGKYYFGIDDHGFSSQMDYFFISGPSLKQTLDNYTQLTGRPRLPTKAMFGLQLSDKGHDHNSETPSDVNWWKNTITKHREAGYPIDHVINDNRWRAAGGKRCESRIEWDPERYPAPAEYKQWLDENGLVLTLDFNRCIAQYSEGWKPAFNLPTIGEIEFPKSAPDLTSKDFRDWFWQVFYDKALDPALKYPGDALWIDEFDEQGAAAKDMMLANGLSSGEMRNYWFFLIAKALVEQGWDKAELNKRPFVWVRGMTAGAQRYATLWSGDIYPNYPEMEGQIRGMQMAGLSGFPYWGHDAGGFFDWKNNLGPDEPMYAQWSMAFGAFAPIWKPHGMGASRWPMDRNGHSQNVAKVFSELRYTLMPYTYTAAHEAASSGLPMARAMILDYQQHPQAWKYDLQYMWGDDLLVAPVSADNGSKDIWLPPGKWFAYGENTPVDGGKVITASVKNGELPLFVKQGAIIPKRKNALSTAFLDKTQLTLDIYTGSNGNFVLVEDDDVTEQYRLDNAMAKTTIEYSHKRHAIMIKAAEGSYQGMPELRDIQINLFGLSKDMMKKVARKHVDAIEKNGVLTLNYSKVSVSEDLTVRLIH